ncbi:T9SS type A sorting domain-containing protein [Flavobacterium zhairuonense]|uniref:ELWxxDGT repeat protein n=1 Tax=Flavobacterium zhairuonense TaxID=2493631 RepID=UPI00105243D4|nr:ELWxxDGT repeat protein [Flavobacterium zhairuonense]KAF2511446.1 T9SS type A sorting domain-containing protein [Flavobacterium zhairuonense]
MKYKITLLLFLAVFTFTNAQTIDATLVELNFREDSDPQKLTPFKSGFFFTATDGYFKKFGRELWYSNGTTKGTSMVKDIKPGQSSSNPSSLTVVENLLYFTAYDEHGTELWKSDGTEAGTSLVKDIKPNNTDEYNGPTELIGWKGKLYFNASNEFNGSELWTSDGTEAGTHMVKDINPKGNASPSNLFIFNNALYFIADDGVNGFELWISDGTESGTKMVKNISPNSSGLTFGNQFLILNNNFYFFANNTFNNYELWKSDGTESGTQMVKDINASNNSITTILKGVSLDNLIIFEVNDGINGSEIWKSDGTESGTMMVKNINNTATSSISYDNKFVVFNNEAYFLANDNVNGTEIWKTNGTASGTILLKDISEGPSSVWIEKIHVDKANNKLLFYSTSTNYPEKKLWVSDGTATGTFKLSDVQASNISGIEQSFVSVNNKTYLTGQTEKEGNELWSTDGTKSGTSFFADLNYSNSSYASKFTNVNGNLFFSANGKQSGNQLFKSDGTVLGTKMIKDINPGYNGMDNLSEMKAINGTLFFSGIDATHGYELWKSDGTENGTIMVKDINPGNKSSLQNYNDKQSFTVINNILYFSADNGLNGFELWRSDGTESGTYMIKDIATDRSSYPRSFTSLNNTIYFIANDLTGSALWTTDGTQSGTIKITNLNDMRVLQTVNNKLFIVAETSGTSYGPHDVWVSDGTASGTSHIKSFGDNIDSDIQITASLKNEIYFVARSPESYNKAVYKTDGTIGGTVLLFDGATHPISNLDINTILTCGEYVYFVIEDYLRIPRELWRTNGKITEQVANTETAVFTYIRGLTCFNKNLLYFLETFPHKVSMINDQLAQPVELDINLSNGQKFADNEGIEELGATDNTLYFRARTDISGNELYIAKINSPNLSTIDHNNIKNNDLKRVSVYPNPANKIINIKSFDNSEIVKFEIWDVNGKKIQEQFNEDLKGEIKYDVSWLHTGIYFMKVLLSDGKVNNVKIIINH